MFERTIQNYQINFHELFLTVNELRISQHCRRNLSLQIIAKLLNPAFRAYKVEIKLDRTCFPPVTKATSLTLSGKGLTCRFMSDTLAISDKLAPNTLNRPFWCDEHASFMMHFFSVNEVRFHILKASFKNAARVGPHVTSRNW